MTPPPLAPHAEAPPLPLHAPRSAPPPPPTTTNQTNRSLQKQVATRGDTLELADLPVVGQIIVEAAVSLQREVFYTEGPPALAAALAANMCTA